MMKFRLQYFGGRGSAGGNKPTSVASILKLPAGSVISVQDFSAITGKPTGTYTDYSLDKKGRWSSQGKGSFDNTVHEFSRLNSKDNTIPIIKIKRVGKGKS